MVIPKIWVKSYPFIKEVEALKDIKADGMEVFLSDDKQKSEEVLKCCSHNYPRVGIELFVYEDEHKGKCDLIYDVFSEDSTIKEKSKKYLLNSLELAAKHNCTHLQIDSNDGYRGRPRQDMTSQKQKLLKSRKELLEKLHKEFQIPIYFENGFMVDDHSKEIIFSSFGHNILEFARQGIPLVYDLAHHAIALDMCSRAEEFGLCLNQEEEKFVKEVREKTMNQVLLDQINQIPGFYFTHFDNASRFELGGQKPDTAPENSDENIFDLEQILPVLMNRSENIAPEVGDNDFVARPNLKAWVKKLQEMNN